MYVQLRSLALPFYNFFPVLTVSIPPKQTALSWYKETLICLGSWYHVITGQSGFCSPQAGQLWLYPKCFTLSGGEEWTQPKQTCIVYRSYLLKILIQILSHQLTASLWLLLQPHSSIPPPLNLALFSPCIFVGHARALCCCFARLIQCFRKYCTGNLISII